MTPSIGKIRQHWLWAAFCVLSVLTGIVGLQGAEFTCRVPSTACNMPGVCNGDFYDLTDGCKITCFIVVSGNEITISGEGDCGEGPMNDRAEQR